MTLDGLEKVIQDKYHRNSKGKIESHYRAKTKVNLVRYTDDFVITANSKELLKNLKLLLVNSFNQEGSHYQKKRLRLHILIKNLIFLAGHLKNTTRTNGGG